MTDTGHGAATGRRSSFAITVHLPVVTRAVPMARDTVRAALKRCDLGGDLVGDVLVVTSELVTNAVRHGGASPDAPVQIRMAIDGGRLRIEVTDPGPGFAPEPTIEPGAHGGFGLRLLADQSDGWGVERGDGTTVWFELELEPAVAKPS